MRRAVALAATAAVLWVAAVTFVVVDTSAGRSSLLQGNDGFSVAQRMERFGRQLEREGVRGAGAQLAMEGSELAKQQLSLTRDSYAAQNGAYAPAKPGEVQYAPELGGTNGVFSQSNGGGNGWARRPGGAATAGLRGFRRGGGAHSVVKQIEAERSHPRRPKLMLQPKASPNAPGHQSGQGWWEAPRRTQPLKASGLMLQPHVHNLNNAAGFGESGVERKPADSEGQWWEGDHREAPLKATGLRMVGLEGAGGAEVGEGAAGGGEGGGGESPVEAAEEAAQGQERVATGKPGAYDGAWGAQFRKDAGGHDSPLRRAGVRTDDYPLDIYRGVPFFAFDPAATTQRAMSQRAGAGNAAEPYTVSSGKRAGHEVWPAGWGQLNEGSPGGDRLRRGGIVVDRWPIDGERGFPNPAWDKEGYDQSAGLNVAKPMDAREVVLGHRASQAKAEAAGIRVNGFPVGDGDGKAREYNSVDGMLDTVVRQDPVPKFRKGGVASQERPLHFLLDEDANGRPKGQADAIGKVWAAGRLDERPQWQENREEGVEFDPSNPAHLTFQEGGEGE